MAWASLLAIALTLALGLLLLRPWQEQRNPAGWQVLAHGGAAAAALLLLLIAAGGRSAGYAWALAALSASIALGMLMFLYRERQGRFPVPLLGLHLAGGLLAAAALAALALS